MAYVDLRAFLDRLEEAGELTRIPGVHWNLEMGALAEVAYERYAPAILFEEIPRLSSGLPSRHEPVQHRASRSDGAGVGS